MKSFVIIVLLVITTAVGFGQTTTVVSENINNAGSAYYFHQRKIARSSTGLLMVVWTDLNTGGSQIQNSVYDADFQIWSPPSVVSSAGERALQPTLAADESGNIHAVWQQRNTATEPYQIYYSKYDGANWSTPIPVSVSNRGEEGTIEVSSTGTLWVVYNNDASAAGPDEYVYAVNSTDGGTTWSPTAEKLSSSGVLGGSIEVARTALAPGPNGKMLAVWDNTASGIGTDYRETYANQFDGSAWRGEELVSDSAATTAENRLGNRYCTGAIDNNSNTYVFYHINRRSADTLRPRQIVMHKKAWNDSWSPIPTTVIESHPTIGQRSISATVDSNNVIHLAYDRDMASDTTYSLDEIVYTYSADGGMNWSPRVAVNRSSYDGGYVTVANRVRRAYGIDIAWRESQDSLVGDQTVTAMISANVPYSLINSVDGETPMTYETLSNYPNPFNPQTTLEFSIPERSWVRLVIFDGAGRQVKTLVSEERSAGHYRDFWDGTDAHGQRVASGVYFLRLSTSASVQTVKMILLK
jgi:hypothetical protein